MSSIYQSRINIADVPRSSVFLDRSYIQPRPISSFYKNDRELSMDFGALSSENLAHLIDPKQLALRNPSIRNLATTHNGRLILNKNTLKQIDELYPKNIIAFYAVYGKKDAGKSFWCNRTYDLSDVGKGNGKFYTQNRDENGIYFLNVPFTKENIKIFLLDCTGFERENLTREEEIRLDTIMTLSSAVLIVPEPSDKECRILSTAYTHFKESQQRLRMFDEPASKLSTYWPHSCYCLYRTTEPVQKAMEDIGTLFNDYNFSIIHDAKLQGFEGDNKDLLSTSFLKTDTAINEQYLNHVSYVTKDVYEKIWGKRFGNLRSNGRVVSKMLPQFQTYINAKQKVPMEKIIDETTKNLYDDTVMRGSQYYLSTGTKQAFKGIDLEKPVNSQNLAYYMGQAKEKTFNHFDNESREIDPESPYADKAEIALEHSINAEQKKFVDSNRKFSMKTLNETMPYCSAQNVRSTEQFRNYLQTLKGTNPQVDEGRSEVVNERLKQGCKQVPSYVFFISEETEKIMRLEKDNENKRKKILSLEKKLREKKHDDQKVNESVVILREKGKDLDDELERLKRRNDFEEDLQNNPNQEEADRLRVQFLRKSKLQYQERLRKAEREKAELVDWVSDPNNLNRDGMISGLNSKLEDKRKEREQNQRIFMTSQLTSRLVPSGLKGAERRPIKEQKNISRSRFG